MSGRIFIGGLAPLVAGGRYPAKAVPGEQLPIAVTAWREGHAALAVDVVWRGPADEAPRRTRMRLAAPGTDQWTAEITPDDVGLWAFHSEAWGDPWATWEHAMSAKVADGQDGDELAADFQVGASLLRRAARRARRAERALLIEAAAKLSDPAATAGERLACATAAPVSLALAARPLRELVTKGPAARLQVDRARALHGAWYELFPRSTGGRDPAGLPVHGTFTTAAAALDRVAAMGFDVVYLPPIHPIGAINRKGRNNTPGANPADVGSPWAIGSADGGHDAVHPELGGQEGFARFVARAGELGMEVALDLALQCAPDHPWVSEHPEWFVTRPDGSVAYAENPPKKYEDIYPLDFDRDPDGLYAEILRVVLHWVAHGVRIFRVDNPHTKPPNFWHRLIGQVKEADPAVLFLAEAFTRPARLYGLAALGFDQSYTYFTWRETKEQLTEFGRELVAHAHESRPNLFVTTPDILPIGLHGSPPAMSALRAALAATLSPTWGVYAGFELNEVEPREPGSEEHLDSEKYELRPREFAGALATGRSLEPWLTRLNQIRRAHPALRSLRSLRFHHIDDDALIAYSKSDPATGDLVLCVVTLDPLHVRAGTLHLDLGGTRVTAHDEVTGQTWRWGETAHIRLDPAQTIAHIVHIRPDDPATDGN